MIEAGIIPDIHAVEGIVLYRLDARSCLDQELWNLESGLLGLTLYWRTFTMMKETPKGYWVVEGHFGSKQRLVLKEGKKRFAYPTKQEALQSFIARKKRQLAILKPQVIYAELALTQAKQLREDDKFMKV